MAYQLDKTRRPQGTNGGRQLARREALSPPSALTGLRQEIDRLFADFVGDEMAVGGKLPMPFGGAFTPRLDVNESEREISISTELPGVEQKDVNVEVADGELTISGEKRQEHQDENEEGWKVVERSFCSFRRVIPLPEEVDSNAIKARFKDGVLNVTIPKTGESRSRKKKIEISSGNR